jgi:hypothetical protein
MRDVTAAGHANSAVRRRAAADILAKDSSDLLARFRDLAARSQFSTNVTADKVLAYDRDGRIVPSGQVYFDATRLQPEGWRRRREAFEDLWEHGREFVYGSVNAGNMGAEKFGSYCLVSQDPSREPGDALAVFPSDSAQRYTKAPATVDETRAVTEVTAWEDRADLALAERAHAVDSDEGKWSDVICSRDRYLEVVWTPPPRLDVLAEVRIREKQLRQLRKLRTFAKARRPLGSADLNEAVAYHVLRSWERTGILHITNVST